MYHTTKVVGEANRDVVKEVVTKNANALVPDGTFSFEEKIFGSSVLKWKLPEEWGGFIIAIRIEPAPAGYLGSVELFLEVDRAPSIQAADKLLETLAEGLPEPRKPSNSIWDWI